MTRAFQVGPNRPLEAIARRIAFVWAPALGRERALEAARATMTPFSGLTLADANDPTFGLFHIASEVLTHRVLAFGWRLGPRAVSLLALNAERVAAEHLRTHLRSGWGRDCGPLCLGCCRGIGGVHRGTVGGAA